MKKNKLIIWLTIFVFLFSMPSAAASKKKEEAAVRKTVTSFLKNTKKYNNKKIISTLLPADKRNELHIYNTNSQIAKSIRKIHKSSFLYKIDKIKVSGKTAKAVVYVTYYDGKQTFINAFIKAVNYIAANDLKYSDNLFMDKFYKFSLEDYKKNDGIYTKTVKSTIPLKKYKGKWKISKVTKQMTAYINCNYVAGQKNIEKIYG